MGEGEFVMVGGRGNQASMVLYKTREQFAEAIIIDGEEIQDYALGTIYGVNVYSGNQMTFELLILRPKECMQVSAVMPGR